MSAGRKYCTPKEKQAILESQDGLCSCGCGQPVAIKVMDKNGVDYWQTLEGVEWEHTIANWLKAGKPDAAMLKDCHGWKTKKDIGRAAKDKRLRGETTSQWNGDNRFKGRIPKGQKLSGGSFQKGDFYRGLDGKLKERRKKP